MALDNQVATVTAILAAVVSAIAIVSGGYNITSKLVRIETQLELNEKLIYALQGTIKDRWTRADMAEFADNMHAMNPNLVLPKIERDNGYGH